MLLPKQPRHAGLTSRVSSPVSMAAKASASAVQAFHATPYRDPEGVMTAVHRALNGTRGGAVAVVGQRA